MGAAFGAIAGGLKDVLGGRLGGLALLCLVVALGVTAGLIWAALEFLPPWIRAQQISISWLGYQVDMSTSLGWLAGVGAVVLALVLAPTVSMIVGGTLFDVAAARVEKAIGAPAGRAIPFGEGLANGFRIGLPALAFNVLAIPLYFIPVVNLITFFWLNGYLMGREYSALAAVRRMSWQEARVLRRRAPFGIFLVGLVCSVIPFIAPLIGASAMTRLMFALSSSGSGTRA